MDPLDVMLNLEHVIPYYQPVISADTQRVIGYEVSASFFGKNNEHNSLNWFFVDSQIPADFQLELSSYILNKVLDTYLEQHETFVLFINYNAKLLHENNGEVLLSNLETYADKGLDLSNIVIQLKDEDIVDEMDSLHALLKYMKAMGIQIAIDHVGQRNGSLEQLVTLKPNLVGIDTGFLKDDDLPHLYSYVHHSLSMLARKIGATLLFKGISTYNQLNYAWRNGGRYYQGTYLKQAEPDYVEPDCCKEKIERDFQLFVNYERKKMQAQLGLISLIHHQFITTLHALSPDDPYDKIIDSVGHACDDFVFRVYITNEEGIQLSSNAEKNQDGTWELNPAGKQKNWSWRPYFFENIIRMNLEKKGILSDLYTDIHRNEQIRTFSYPLTDDRYIFLDIPYDYLFEQEGLL
ncbi:EAL domain-containing protein [Oceanobacillus piezotolerans]|uniref:EAL domain-containing protein n=1 Tax=Oceanobacillus piezotolerans TaxID=2448030 RepID=A0A498DE56_9BACI|nr:EAL domain-containing protein [Oceanobacillus piezotolerans]RLL46950.1 EAL domain-containing protein [Oceanobacillus piezotolerans]